MAGEQLQSKPDQTAKGWENPWLWFSGMRRVSVLHCLSLGL